MPVWRGALIVRFPSTVPGSGLRPSVWRRLVAQSRATRGLARFRVRLFDGDGAGPSRSGRLWSLGGAARRARLLAYRI